MATGLFSDDYNIYWPSDYEDIVTFLSSADSESNTKVFKTFMEVIVFAAAIGLREGLKPPFDYKSTKEIRVSTFLGSRSKRESLAEIIYLIALCDPPESGEDIDIDLMRGPEGEKKAIHIFQRYAAGGLSYLNSEYISRPKQDRYRFVYEIAKDYFPKTESADSSQSTIEGSNQDPKSKVKVTPLDLTIG